MCFTNPYIHRQKRLVFVAILNDAQSLSNTTTCWYNRAGFDSLKRKNTVHFKEIGVFIYNADGDSGIAFAGILILMSMFANLKIRQSFLLLE
jgi:hypothetical protein